MDGLRFDSIKDVLMDMVQVRVVTFLEMLCLLIGLLRHARV
jgi:hypothetical protein